MIGFPKRRADFQDGIYKRKIWQKSFDQQIDSYLDPSCLSSERKKDWKYFPLKKALSENFAFDFESAHVESPQPELKGSFLIHVKNGKAQAPPHPEISLFCWSEFLSGKAKLAPGLSEKILYSLNQKRNHFCSLNNTFFPKGFILILKKNLSQPVEIHYSQDSESAGQGLNLRSFIFIESKAQVIEVLRSRGSGKALFLNLQTDCFLEEKAHLEFSCLDQTGEKDVLIHQMFAHLSKESQAQFFALCLNAGLSRWLREIHQEEKSKSQIRALSLMSGSSHTDHKVSVRHKGPLGASEQFYKSFLFDSARHIFQGRISIDPAGRESDARQLNKNYLFGSKASAVSLPELDVWPSQVKAGHGATVSSFNEKEELIFYLKSRGIDPALSFDLVLLSLLKETFSHLGSAAQSAIQSLVQNQLLVLRDSIAKL